MNKENNYIKALENFQFSSFNPVPPSRKMAGDLFYLTAKTSDGIESGITCCVNGFYKNDSIEKSVFNPSPSTRKNPLSGKSNVCFSYTLMGCLNQISSSFSKNLQQYMNQILNTEQYFLTQPTLKVYHWAHTEDRKPNQTINQGKLCDVVNPLFGLDPKGIRDWNEEY